MFKKPPPCDMKARDFSRTHAPGPVEKINKLANESSREAIQHAALNATNAGLIYRTSLHPRLPGAVYTCYISLRFISPDRPARSQHGHRFSWGRHAPMRISRSEKIMSHPRCIVGRIQMILLPCPLELDLLTHISLSSVRVFSQKPWKAPRLANRRDDRMARTERWLSRECCSKDHGQSRYTDSVNAVAPPSFLPWSRYLILFSASTLSRGCSAGSLGSWLGKRDSRSYQANTFHVDCTPAEWIGVEFTGLIDRSRQHSRFLNRNWVTSLPM